MWLVCVPSSAAAHGPDCYRNAGIAGFIVLVGCLLAGAWTVERRYGRDASGVAPVLTWLGLVAVSMIAGLLIAAFGAVGWC
ncbi:MAG: hypothetical protein VYE22_39135 [Myxococcota bacterium]|nr:hypothetical protein [Myxococcota bacterium]